VNGKARQLINPDKSTDPGTDHLENICLGKYSYGSSYVVELSHLVNYK
jgi:hypothetical protein